MRDEQKQTPQDVCGEASSLVKNKSSNPFQSRSWLSQLIIAIIRVLKLLLSLRPRCRRRRRRRILRSLIALIAP